MRILIISNLYPPNTLGGYERLCHQVAAALVERGHEITVLTSDYGGKIADFPGQKVHRTLQMLADGRDIYRPFEATPAMRETINTSNISELSRVTKTARPDVIFCWNLYFLDRTFQASLAGQPIPVAYFLTDNWMIAALTPQRIGDFFERFVNGSEQFSSDVHLATLDHHISGASLFGSQFVQKLHRACGFEFDYEEVIHNGVDLMELDTELLPNRARSVTPGELRLLFAGRLVDLKGAHDCVEALPLIASAMPEMKVLLTLMGDAQDQIYRQKLQHQIETLGVAASVAFAPAVPEARLVEAFMSHDIYLFPSHYEPFALTLIHAMGAGIPTIASNAGGNPEIVMDRRTGLVFEKGNVPNLASQVVTLANDPELRVALSMRAQRLARRFSFGRMVAQVERAMSRIAGRTAPDTRA